MGAASMIHVPEMACVYSLLVRYLLVKLGLNEVNLLALHIKNKGNKNEDVKSNLHS